MKDMLYNIKMWLKNKRYCYLRRCAKKYVDEYINRNDQDSDRVKKMIDAAMIIKVDEAWHVYQRECKKISYKDQKRIIIDSTKGSTTVNITLKAKP